MPHSTTGRCKRKSQTGVTDGPLKFEEGYGRRRTGRHDKTRACEVVDALEGLTPYEGALVWREVELALDELTITTTATIAQREARKTPMRC